MAMRHRYNDTANVSSVRQQMRKQTQPDLGRSGKLYGDYNRLAATDMDIGKVIKKMSIRSSKSSSDIHLMDVSAPIKKKSNQNESSSDSDEDETRYTGKRKEKKPIKLLADEAKLKKKIQSLSNKTHISFADRRLDNDMLMHICEAIQDNNNIKTLSLRNVQMTDSGLCVISQELINNTSEIKTINFSTNTLTTKCVPHLELLLNKGTVEVLLLHDNYFEEDGTQALMKLLGSNKQLASGITTLDLGENNIGDYGMAAIGRYLAMKETRLQRLIIDGNRSITNDGWKKLAEGIKKSQLSTLSADLCKMTDESVIMLCEALSGSETLQQLGLEGNNISEKSGNAVVRLVRSLPNLTKLSIKAGNNLSTMQLNQLDHIIKGSDNESGTYGDILDDNDIDYYYY